MPQPDPPSFHLRLPPELKDKLQSVRGGNSLNTEIVQRLERSLEPDPAMRLANALRPLLASLTDDERDRFVSLAIDAAGILAASGRRRKSKD